MDLQDRSILLAGADGGSGAAVALELAARSEQHAVTVVRGHATRTAMITSNREDPATVDRTLLARQGALEEAVAGHSSL